MKLKLDEMTDILQKEITWCLDNPDITLSDEFQEGFISGLMQAQDLIKKAERTIREDNE